MRAEAVEQRELPEVVFDPVLMRNRKAYVRLVKDLDRRGMLRWQRNVFEQVGLFFVRKSGGDQIRMITDARRANMHFAVPPGVRLVSAEGLGRVRVELPPDVDPWSEAAREMLDGFTTYLTTADVKDCFHRLEMPAHLSRFFGLPGGEAREFGVVGQEVEGHPAERHDWVTPCWRM